MELLVVILIISVLSGIVISTLNIQGTKAKTRDAQRSGDIKKIQTALEAYYMDYRYYPDTGGAWEVINGTSGVLYTALVGSGNYLSDLPVDPIGLGVGTYSSPCNALANDYYYRSDGGSYKIVGVMELDRSVDPADACVASEMGCVLQNPDYCYEVNNP